MPNHSELPPREVVETPEYTANYDAIVEQHSLAVVGPILTGLIEGIAKTREQWIGQRDVYGWQKANPSA
jgi:hypothetical protein